MPILPQALFTTTRASSSRLPLALLANNDHYPPFFQSQKPPYADKGKGKKAMRPGDEEDVDDAEWLMRVGSGILHLRATLPHIFHPPQNIFPTSVYSNSVSLSLPAPLPLKVSSLPLYSWTFTLARHGMHGKPKSLINDPTAADPSSLIIAIYTDLGASLDKLSVSSSGFSSPSSSSVSPASKQSDPATLLRRQRGRDGGINRQRQVRALVEVTGVPRLGAQRPTSWQTSSLYTFSPISGLIIHHEVETIRPLPGEGVGEWLSERLWGWRGNPERLGLQAQMEAGLRMGVEKDREGMSGPVPVPVAMAVPAQPGDLSAMKDRLRKSHPSGEAELFARTPGGSRRGYHTSSVTNGTASTVKTPYGPIRVKHPGQKAKKGAWTPAELKKILRKNDELSPEDVENEYRWIEESSTKQVEAWKTAGDKRGKGHASHGINKLIYASCQRRATGEPLQYILGDTDFGPLNLLCSRPVLIPRPETAHVFGELAKYIRGLMISVSDRTELAELRMLDLYTGSGAIALLMRHEVGPVIRCKGLGVDYLMNAVRLATVNELRTKYLPGIRGRTSLQFIQADILEPEFVERTDEILAKHLEGLAHIVTANPPYIPWSEYTQLPKSVRQFESMEALLGDGRRQDPVTERQGDGLSHYRQLAKNLKHLALPADDVGVKMYGGKLPRVAVEIGAEQGDRVKEIFLTMSDGFIKRVHCWKDQYGKDRLVVGWDA